MKTKENAPVEKASPHREAREFMKALAAPFEPAVVRFKPAVVSGNRALALAYVDARAIQDRLDEVLGVDGWQDDYECLPDGSVVCRLRLRLGDEWVTKVDVGSPSEQPDSGDRLKAAFSDALKRAAVKFGIGRYLYRLPSQWVDYDPRRRQLARTPTLPAFALPTKQAPTPPPERPTLPVKGRGKAEAAPAHTVPSNGAELQRRLDEYDARMAAHGLWARGALMEHIARAGDQAGHGADVTKWSGPAITLAVEETKAFEAKARQNRPERKEVA
jgi:hypothetical protein